VLPVTTGLSRTSAGCSTWAWAQLLLSAVFLSPGLWRCHGSPSFAAAWAPGSRVTTQPASIRFWFLVHSRSLKIMAHYEVASRRLGNSFCSIYNCKGSSWKKCLLWVCILCRILYRSSSFIQSSWVTFQNEIWGAFHEFLMCPPEERMSKCVPTSLLFLPLHPHARSQSPAFLELVSFIYKDVSADRRQELPSVRDITRSRDRKRKAVHTTGTTGRRCQGVREGSPNSQSVLCHVTWSNRLA